jgi:hypothetical protein
MLREKRFPRRDALRLERRFVCFFLASLRALEPHPPLHPVRVAAPFREIRLPRVFGVVGRRGLERQPLRRQPLGVVDV